MPRAEAKVYIVADARQAKRAFNDLSRQGTSTGASIGRALGTVAKTGALALAAGLTTAAAAMVFTGVSAVKAAADMEQQEIAFETLLGSAKKSTKFLKELEQFAMKTPFEFSDLVVASKRMLALGWAAKDIIPDLEAIGNVVSAMGGGAEMVDRVTLALGQMRMKGRVSAEEMLQLTEANINGWGYLADALDVSKAKAREMAEQGKIGADWAVQAIIKGMETDKRFKGMMERQAGTLAGIWSNLKDAWEKLLRVIGKIIIKNLDLKQKIQDAAVWMGKFAKVAERKGWQKAFENMVPGGDEIVEIIEKAWDYAKRFGNYIINHKDEIAEGFETILTVVSAIVDALELAISTAKYLASLFDKGGGSGRGKGKTGTGSRTTPSISSVPVYTPWIPEAEGGIVSRPQLSLIGEAGPEAIVPLTNPARAAEVLAASGLLSGDTIVNVFLDGKLIEKQVTKRQSERLRRLERAYA